MNVCTILYNVSLAAPVLSFQRFKLHLTRIKVSFMYSSLCGLSSSQSSSSVSIYSTKSSPSVPSHVFLFFRVMSLTTYCSVLDHSLPLGIFIFVSCFRNLMQSLQSCNIATSCWSLVCQGIFPCVLDSGRL